MPNQFVDLIRNIFNPTSPSSNRRHRTPSPESDDSDEDQQRAERLLRRIDGTGRHLPKVMILMRISSVLND
ncbi:unnamed protein product [Anisakis simplex]|uniref:ORF3 n=1 Tax=Anisakis simplex TaxID=6269 RepID=A0A0M3KJS9_ANISI|nr:unnamed protein product [Anisakis simplex]